MSLRGRIEHFISLEALSGILLLLSLLLALYVSNSHLYDEYQSLAKLPISITIGSFSISKPLIKWVNDGLMVFFFLLLTIEAKFHCLEGEFSSKSALTLPVVAALGGAIVPPLIYYLFTADNIDSLNGWAIPIGTDTAFVLGILSFFSHRIPLSVRLFVVALSIIDDFIAVLVLAIFYTSSLHFIPLLIAFICLLILALLYSLRVSSLLPYLLVGAALWLALIEAGIHGTIAGVFLGIFIPLYSKSGGNRGYSPLKELENFIHPIVAFIILPLFVFLNGEIPFKELSFGDLLSPITVGILVGLFIGKQLGIILFSYIAIRMNMCKLPSNVSWKTYYGVSILCGIGFTFSIFIGLLSFDDAFLINQMKLGVTLGSLLSALIGIVVLNHSLQSPVTK